MMGFAGGKQTTRVVEYSVGQVALTQNPFHCSVVYNAMLKHSPKLGEVTLLITPRENLFKMFVETTQPGNSLPVGFAIAGDLLETLKVYPKNIILYWKSAFIGMENTPVTFIVIEIPK